ncbi:MAG: hypothetical protein AB1487_06760 [Thermodesulfobacteriota bacterium]
MSYVVNLKRSAEKELERLPAKAHDKIVTSLISLQHNPRPSLKLTCLGAEKTAADIIERYISTEYF